MWHNNCRKQLSDLKYPPCWFNECNNNTTNNTNGDNSDINYNDNDNNDDNYNGNADNENKNINDGKIHFYNS